MSVNTQGPKDKDGPELQANVERVRTRGDGLEVTLRLTNPDPARALHYVSDVRGIVVDDATGVVTVRLTDQGRAAIPGAANVLPDFRRVDPGGTSLLAVRLPPAIIRMRRRPTPTAEVEVERLEVTTASPIEIVVGWSDTPYYPDTRPGAADTQSTVAWEKGAARVVVEPKK